MDIDQHRYGCHHEAGHAVGYLARGAVFERITADPNTLDAEVVPSRHQRALPPDDQLIVTYAGPVAERQLRAGGPPVPPAWLGWDFADYHPDDDEGSDFDVVSRARLKLGITDSPDAYEQEARDLVATWWTAITALAEALYTRHDLSYDDVLAITGWDDEG